MSAAQRAPSTATWAVKSKDHSDKNFSRFRKSRENFFSPDLDYCRPMMGAVDKRSARRSAKADYKWWQKRKKRPGAATPKRLKGGDSLYTEYGFVVDGIEYATAEEAYERSENPD